MKINNIKGIIPFTEKKIDIDVNGKNLIITGKNGCGKTLLLASIYQVIKKAPSYITQKKTLVERHERRLLSYLKAIDATKKRQVSSRQSLANNEAMLRNKSQNLIQQQKGFETNIITLKAQISDGDHQLKKFTDAIEKEEATQKAALLKLRTDKDTVKELTTKETI